MLKTIIMDFDGLIVDTEVVWYQLYVEWFKIHKQYDLSVLEFLTCVGSSPADLFCVLDAKGIHVDQDCIARDTQQRFIEESGKLPAKPGVEAFLRAAREQGLKIALATSAGRAKPTFHLKRLALMDYFDLLVTAEDVTRIKPYPDLFLTTAERLNCKPEECLVVEDSLNGLLAGKNANMRVLVVPNDVTKHCVFEGHYRIYDSLEQADISDLIATF